MTHRTDFIGLKAIIFNCTLKKSPAPSHTSSLVELSVGIMERENVQVDQLRIIDHDIPPGEHPDMTKFGWENDEWPKIFKQVEEADILIIATPIWLGQLSSITKKLIERLDGMGSKLNEKGQYIYYGKVGGCMITGNEDGLKHISMEVLYSLQHLGFSIPPQSDCGWIGEVGPGPSYGDMEYKGREVAPPAGYDSDFTNRNVTFMTYNLLHLALMLKNQNGYPNYGNSAEQWEKGERWEFKKPT
tara:strand:- start:24950 stop:25681 length:732 start_codon:yes stop_codon:yes gene_type:complete